MKGIELNNGVSSHFLFASTIHVSKQEILIQTVLGSCVAVCLWDKQLNIGGMNHYMLPYWDGKGLNSPKYGNIAISRLYEKMLSYGSIKENLIAKVFGGAEIIKGNNNTFNIGARNVTLAWEILEELKIPIISHNVGGSNGRKIFFNTAQGVVHLKMLNPSNCKVA